MNRTTLFSVLAALALATLSVGVYGFYALDIKIESRQTVDYRRSLTRVKP